MNKLERIQSETQTMVKAAEVIQRLTQENAKLRLENAQLKRVLGYD